LTEFYILGPDGLAENYPREAAVGQPLSLTFGIANQERGRQSYWLEVWAVDPWSDRQELVNRAGPFQLDAGDTLEQPIGWAMPWAGDDQQVIFYLMNYDEPEAPYRQLHLWLDVVK
jgi:uncharacterized membrane protein